VGIEAEVEPLTEPWPYGPEPTGVETPLAMR
jgi:hypothetical protein